MLGFNAAKEKLEIVSGAAPPPFRIFAGGFTRRLRRRNAFGLIQEYCTFCPRSSAEERFPPKEEARGSNPLGDTINTKLSMLQ